MYANRAIPMRQVGGLGLYLITRLMDEVRFDFNPQGGNLLTMVKYITPGPRDEVVVGSVGQLGPVISVPAETGGHCRDGGPAGGREAEALRRSVGCQRRQ